MSGIDSILYMNFFAITLLIGMSLAVLTNTSMPKYINRHFFAIAIIVLLINLVDIGLFYFRALPKPTIWLYLLSATGYTFRPIAILLIDRMLLQNKKNSKYLWLPMCIVAIFSYTSYFTRWAFWFDVNNNFMRGPLSLLPHFVSLIYGLLLIILTLKEYHYITFLEFFNTIYIVLLCAVATVIESVWALNFLLSGSMIVSCTIYYIFMCSQAYKYDSLTGLLNRRSFYTDTNKLSKYPIVVISIDMNGLKKINDSKGHLAGDMALKNLSNIFLHNTKKNFYAYRTGGDEFFIIGKRESEQTANLLIKKIKQELNVVGLTASFGCVMYKPGDNFSEICEIADSRMYEEKKNSKMARE